MKRISPSAILVAFLLCCNFSIAQKYSKAKLFVSHEQLQMLANAGIAVDHGNSKEGSYFISEFSESELALISEKGVAFEILVDDVIIDFIERNKHQTPLEKNTNCPTGASSGPNPTTPANFNLGSMGGYLTYSEMLDELDDMAAAYPNLITVKAPISTFLTAEGRPLHFVKISDNPSTDEDATEPSSLYTALHHAREPMSLMTEIYYMWYLLENYATNPEVKYLVDNTQMFFVPCVNPDGYVYNETTNPNGGGMWRKNRRNNGGGVYGVDLNRNYSHGWGTTGTSFNTSNDTYCGTAAFSEPETQALRFLVQQHNFQFAFNCHTYGNDLLFPLGTIASVFADHHDYFQDETNHMALYNGWSAFKSSGLYEASGDSDDYMYMEDIGIGDKDTIFAHTPEIGTSFWPSTNEIIPTCEAMFFPNLVLAHLNLKYLAANDANPSFIDQISGNFVVEGQRLGLLDGPITVSIVPLTNITAVGASTVVDIDLRATFSHSFTYDLNPTIQFGDEIKYIIRTDNGTWVRNDTIIKTFGAYTPQITETGSATNWTGNWGVSTAEFYSATQSYADSPTGNYPNNATRTYTYTPSIDLTSVLAASVSFYAKWEVEADYDYVRFQVSQDGGTSWESQCGNYTNPGTADQAEDEPLYDGVQTSWVFEQIDLSEYIGQTIKFRFILRSDQGVTDDGFYFDDFVISWNEDVSGINEVVNELAMFPNPTTGKLIVQNIDLGTTLQVMDMNGKVVQSAKVMQVNTLLDLSSVQAGVYIVEALKGGSIYRSRLVKQ
ncbi:MAG: M14 family zinc carboxypeptidase [Bacteroidota bacterium]